MRGKKAGKMLNEIGKRWYDFDFELERVIYVANVLKKEALREI